MKIDAYLTPQFTEKENQFENTIVLMIDVLRASTTICATLNRAAKEVIAIDSVDKAVQLFTNLSRESRFLGGERNGIKPSGFDAGNSPDDYPEESVKGKTVIITTTNGTQLFQKCKRAKAKLVAGFVNHTAILEYVDKLIAEDANIKEISVLCAGTDGRLSYEDVLCAGAFINSMKKKYTDVQITDTAMAAKSLFNLHSVDLKNFIKSCEHSLFLEKIGFAKDIDTCLEFDKFPVVPIIMGNSIKIA